MIQSIRIVYTEITHYHSNVELLKSYLNYYLR